MRRLTPVAELIQSPSRKLQISVELHGLTTRLLRCDSPESLGQEMLDALVDYHEADFGTFQLVGPAGTDVEIIAHRGFDASFLETFRNVSSNSPCTCGAALKGECPVVSADIQGDADFGSYADVLKTASVRAVQSTPLIGTDGKVRGVVSTYFREPSLPSRTHMQVTALFAQQGADALAHLQKRELGVEGRGQEPIDADSALHGEFAPVFRKVAQFEMLRADEWSVLQKLIREVRVYETETEFVHEGDSQNDCFVMLEGWGCKYKDLENGTRQIIHFPIPGDFVGVDARLLKSADHSFATITPSKLGIFTAERFQELVQGYPRLGRAILWSAARDKAIMVEHLVNIGRRNAIERIAHFLTELARRMEFAGLVDAGEYRCPLTQEHLADALGLTNIHVNRTLRQLRERGLVSLDKGTLHIKDASGLSDLAAFDSDYLDHAD